MTDMLSLLTRRLTASEPALRPLTKTRFDPQNDNELFVQDEFREQPETESMEFPPQRDIETIKPPPTPARQANPDQQSAVEIQDQKPEHFSAPTNEARKKPYPDQRQAINPNDGKPFQTGKAAPATDTQTVIYEAQIVDHTEPGTTKERLIKQNTEHNIEREYRTQIETQKIERRVIEQASLTPNKPIKSTTAIPSPLQKQSLKKQTATANAGEKPTALSARAKPSKPVANTFTQAPHPREQAKPNKETGQPIKVHIERLEVRVQPAKTSTPRPAKTKRPSAPDLDRFLVDLEGRP